MVKYIVTFIVISRLFDRHTAAYSNSAKLSDERSEKNSKIIYLYVYILNTLGNPIVTDLLQWCLYLEGENLSKFRCESVSNNLQKEHE